MSSRFKVGDSVVVTSGTIDPNTGQDIARWQGRVASLHMHHGKERVTIHWDSITLENMPPAVIEQYEADGMDWAEIVLGVDEIQPAQARDTGQQAREAEEQIRVRSFWLRMGPEGKAIQRVLEGVEPDDDWTAFRAWYRHLSAALKLPFEAEVEDWQEGGPLHAGDKVTVLDFNKRVDDFYGVLMDVKGRGGVSTFPLCDLAAADEQSDNYHVLQEYRVWFANR